MFTSKSISLFTIITLFSLATYSQQYNYALYDINASIDKNSQSDNLNTAKTRVLQQMIRSANLKKLELIFNSKISLFRPVESLDLDDREGKLSKGLLVFLGVENELYIDIPKNSIYKKRGNDSYAHFVEINRENIKWEITSDKKTVNNLTYRKANARLNIGAKEFDVIAWFCPEISVKSGPSYFYDLPGLITEVYVSPLESNLRYSLVLSKLKYDNKFEEINTPLEGYKIYSDEESQKIFRNQLNANFNKN